MEENIFGPGMSPTPMHPDGNPESQDAHHVSDTPTDVVTGQEPGHAQGNEDKHTLALPDLIDRADALKLQRAKRKWQDDCKRGKLDATKKPTINGDAWYVTEESFQKRIVELRQYHEKFGATTPLPQAAGHPESQDAHRVPDTPTDVVTGNDSGRGQVVHEDGNTLRRELEETRKKLEIAERDKRVSDAFAQKWESMAKDESEKTNRLVEQVMLMNNQLLDINRKMMGLEAGRPQGERSNDEGR